MCMEDVILGRETISREVDVTTAISVAQEVLSGSDSRFAVLLGGPSAGFVTWSTNANPVAGAGFVVAAGQVPILLNIKDHGDIVRKQWWVVDDGTSRKVAVVETLLFRRT